MALTGKIYDIQEFSVHDGPGIRTTVFLKGCPLRCPWCHSPESQEFFPQVGYTNTKCIGTELCTECIKVCPAHAIKPAESAEGGSNLIKAVWDRSICLQCAACTKACFPQAFSLIGTDYTVDEVIARLEKSYAYFQSSGGGVTVSGGEPLCQHEFAAEVLKRVKEAGIHTALDTTGFVPWKNVEAVLPYVDLFLYDLKHMSSEKHNETVKVPNERILENAVKIAENGGRFQIRIPVIPGFNNDEQNISETADFCEKIKDAIEVVQVLPYHHYGASKYARLQKYDPMPADLLPPGDEEMQQIVAVFEDHGLNAMIH